MNFLIVIIDYRNISEGLCFGDFLLGFVGKKVEQGKIGKGFLNNGKVSKRMNFVKRGEKGFRFILFRLNYKRLERKMEEIMDKVFKNNDGYVIRGFDFDNIG